MVCSDYADDIVNPFDVILQQNYFGFVWFGVDFRRIDTVYAIWRR